jgi:hypothetical protein
MTETDPGAAQALPAPPSLTTPPSHWQGLRQRFDTLALRPPGESTDDAALARHGAPTRAALQAWCGQGAGPGGTPFWQPGAPPRVGQRLAVGALQGLADAPGPGRPTAPQSATTTDQGPLAPAAAAWVDHLARGLDGSLRLQALPHRAAGLAYRLGVKLHDAQWWRHRLADDPWDAGWALTTPAALQQLQTRFWPRRATLVLADAASWQSLQAALAALRQRQAGFRHPVRWLWVGAESDLQALPAWPGLPVTCFTVASANPPERAQSCTSPERPPA